MVQVKPGTYALSPKINGMTLTEFDNYLILKAKKKYPCILIIHWDWRWMVDRKFLKIRGWILISPYNWHVNLGNLPKKAKSLVCSPLKLNVRAILKVKKKKKNMSGMLSTQRGCVSQHASSWGRGHFPSVSIVCPELWGGVSGLQIKDCIWLRGCIFLLLFALSFVIIFFFFFGSLIV